MSDTPDDRDVAVAMAQEGIATLAELAALLETSRQNMRNWCLAEGIDAPAARATWLRKEWRKRMG